MRLIEVTGTVPGYRALRTQGAQDTGRSGHRAFIPPPPPAGSQVPGDSCSVSTLLAGAQPRRSDEETEGRVLQKRLSMGG